MPVAVVMVAVLTSGRTGCLLIVSTPPLQSQNVQSREKAPASHGARGETPTMSFLPGANREGKERVKGKASQIQSSRIGSVLVFVRRNAQLRELKLLEPIRFVLSTVVMIVLSTDGPTGCLVYHLPLLLQNTQSHEKSPAGREACCGTAHRLLLATAVGYCYNTRGWGRLAQIIANQQIRAKQENAAEFIPGCSMEGAKLSR